MENEQRREEARPGKGHSHAADGQQSSGDAVEVNPIGSKVSLLSTPKARPPRAMPIALPLSKSSVYTLASMPKPGSRGSRGHMRMAGTTVMGLL